MGYSTFIFIYFGNDDPAPRIFNEIYPKISRSLSYWKQFNLTQIGKARIAEMFLTSSLVYAMKFYPIPKKIREDIQQRIFQYAIFPQKLATIAQAEMWKTFQKGGIKLINNEVKSETSKGKWLIDIITKENLKLNLNVFSHLMGTQKGGIYGRDLIFLQKSYHQKQLVTQSEFYRKGLISLSKLEIKKGIHDINGWSQEHIFYNQIFLTDEGQRSLMLTKHCERNKVYNYQQLLIEKGKETRKEPYDKILILMFNRITINPNVPKEHVLIQGDGKEINLNVITQKKLDNL